MVGVFESMVWFSFKVVGGCFQIMPLLHDIDKRFKKYGFNTCNKSCWIIIRNSSAAELDINGFTLLLNWNKLHMLGRLDNKRYSQWCRIKSNYKSKWRNTAQCWDYPSYFTASDLCWPTMITMEHMWETFKTDFMECQERFMQ